MNAWAGGGEYEPYVQQVASDMMAQMHVEDGSTWEEILWGLVETFGAGPILLCVAVGAVVIFRKKIMGFLGDFEIRRKAKGERD